MNGDQIEIVSDRGITFIVTEDSTAECRSCHAPILWCVTARGKKMPVDPPTDDEPTTSHFATCPEANQWRR